MRRSTSLSAFLGLDPDAAAGALRVTASLPEWLTSIRVSELGVGSKVVALTVLRADTGETEVRAESRGGGLIVETDPGRLPL